MNHTRGYLQLVASARKRVSEITAPRVKSRMRRGDKFTVIDVREDHEWNDSHVAGAIHIGRGILERDIEGWIPDKKSEVVLYCGGGYRSVLAAESLQKMGYQSVLSMRGGWKAWRRIRGPVEQGNEQKR
ncbi:MAG: rhodanese-like domain-containing protein [Ignavibacteria bacterium]|nr:rhodanese-like domain-containing protein [Ignavibacteria bacterium]